MALLARPRLQVLVVLRSRCLPWRALAALLVYVHMCLWAWRAGRTEMLKVLAAERGVRHPRHLWVLAPLVCELHGICVRFTVNGP